MKLISQIQGTEGIYILVQMEQAINNFYQRKNYDNYIDKLDYIEEVLRESTIDYIKDNIDQDSKYILDFTGIRTMDSKAETKLKLLLNNKNITIINFDIKNLLSEHQYQGNNESKNYIKQYEQHSRDNVIPKICIENEQENLSSGILLSHYIDIKKIICDNEELFKVCFILANKLKCECQEYDIWEKNRPKLFFQTLNGSAIGSIVAQLLKLEMTHIDHLGPINKLYKNNFRNRIMDRNNYIVVSDVICLGNELQRAANLIEFCGGTYMGYISVVRVEQLNSDQIKHRIAQGVISIETKNDIKLEYDIKL